MVVVVMSVGAYLVVVGGGGDWLIGSGGGDVRSSFTDL